MIKTLHLFWGRSRNLSELRLQTVLTFTNLNPDWKVKVWYRDNEPKSPIWDTKEQSVPYIGLDYFSNLKGIPNVEIVEIPFEINATDVHLSDYWRWEILSQEGGFWSDFDIVYIKPMSTLKNIHDQFLIKYERVEIWPIGFIGACNEKGMDWFKPLAATAKGIVGLANDYQTLGCFLLKDHISKYPVRQIQPMQIVYPEFIMKRVQNNYFTQGFNWSPPQDTIGLHWYAGAQCASEYENNFGNPEQYNTGLARALRGDFA